MPHVQIVQVHEGSTLDIPSFIDKFKIKNFDINRLQIDVGFSYENCYYDTDDPDLTMTITYT